MKEKMKAQRETRYIAQINISNELYKTRQYFSNIDSPKGDNAIKLLYFLILYVYVKYSILILIIH